MGMAVRLTPRERRAEAHRRLINNLGKAATTEELKEAADAVSMEAERAIKGNKNFLEAVKREMENIGGDSTEGE